MNFVYIATITCLASNKRLPSIKIGCSKNPYRRAISLGGCRAPISVSMERMFCFTGRAEAYSVEKHCHDEMIAHRVSGEWYHSSCFDEAVQLILDMGGVEDFTLPQTEILAGLGKEISEEWSAPSENQTPESIFIGLEKEIADMWNAA